MKSVNVQECMLGCDVSKDLSVSLSSLTQTLKVSGESAHCGVTLLHVCGVAGDIKFYYVGTRVFSLASGVCPFFPILPL